MALDFPASSASPFTAPNGVVYTWNTDGYWEAKPGPNDLDSDYLKLDATNGPVTGALTFEGTTTHEGGVEVTGGTDATVANGLTYETDTLNLVYNNVNVARFGLSNNHTNLQLGSETQLSTTGQIYNSQFLYGGTGHTNQIFINVLSAPLGDTGADEVICYSANVDPNNSASKVYGYLCDVAASDAPNGDAYSFYADNDAPSFFRGLTEHASGVEVTGGNANDITRGLYYKDSLVVTNQPTVDGQTCPALTTYLGNNPNNLGNLNLVGIENAGIATTFDRKVASFKPYAAKNFARSGSYLVDNGRTYGFHSDVFALDSADKSRGCDAFQFYAAGDASNFFNGTTIFSSLPNIPGILAGTQNGKYIQPVDGNMISGVDTADNRTHITFTNPNGFIGRLETEGNNLRIIGLAGGPLILDKGADARLITTTEAITDASAVVQQLQPVKINGTRHGFAAAALQPLFAEAVNGTAGATETIGTYTDVDGNVETEVIEPEAIPYGATWTQTGTRDVYQGVDQTKLIPLLTKALQESLTKIETLETRLSDAGIA